MDYNEIYQKAYKNNQLISATIELNTICNYSCVHCYIPNHDEKGISKMDIFFLIDQLFENGTLNLTLTGGEIFLRKDIFEIISYARKKHMRVFLLSNISLLNEEKIIKLKKIFIAEVSTTLFSLNDHINDKVTKGKNSATKIINNLKLLKKHGIRVLLKTPVMNLNSKEYESIHSFANSNGFKFMMSPVIFSKSDRSSDNSNLKMNGFDLIAALSYYNSTINRNEPIIKDTNIPCTALFYNIFVDSKGDVFPCNTLFYKIGNIYDNKIKEIWDNSIPL